MYLKMWIVLICLELKWWFGATVGHAILSINGVDVMGKNTADGKDILEYLKDSANYPVSIRFGRARLSSNEKLMLASMFHSWVLRVYSNIKEQTTGLGCPKIIVRKHGFWFLSFFLSVGCLLSVHSCLLKLEAQGLRCWRRMSSNSTAFRPSQVRPACSDYYSNL